MGERWRRTARSVRRAVGRQRRGPTPAPQPTPAEQLQARVEQAVALVRAVERQEPALPGPVPPRRFLALDRVVRRPDLDPRLAHLVPGRLAGAWDAREGVRQLDLRLAADAVVLAKLDLAHRVKLRAAYGEDALSLAVQPVRRDGSSGITAALRSYELVDRHCPGLAPRLRAHGGLTGMRYLVEDWVDGRPLGSSLRLAEQLVPLLQALVRVQRGHGVRTVRAGDLWPRFPAEWQDVVEGGLVGPGLGRAVRDLLARDRGLRVSWTHGDLAASNIFSTAAGLTLIDWEHARERPVMHDGARLHLFAADPPTTVQRLVEHWGPDAPPGCYSPQEELALLHARFVCDGPRRLARMADHPRRGVYVRQLRRQVALLGDVLSVLPR